MVMILNADNVIFAYLKIRDLFRVHIGVGVFIRLSISFNAILLPATVVARKFWDNFERILGLPVDFAVYGS